MAAPKATRAKSASPLGRWRTPTRDGDLLAVPVPDSIADGLVKESSYKGHDFLVEERNFPMPGPKNPDDPNSAEFGDTPLFVLSNQLKCD